MGFTSLLITAIALAMDAFAVSICKGLASGRATFKNILTVGLYFGGFQAVMPLIGYLLGTRFSLIISNVAPLVAFGLLLLIGINMIRESCGDDEEINDDFSPRAMIPLAIATSIDALAVGVSFAMIRGTNIFSAIALIGVATFVLCAIGLKVGTVFGAKYKTAAERAGGIVLIVMSLKILLEFLFEKYLCAPTLWSGFVALFERLFN